MANGFPSLLISDVHEPKHPSSALLISANAAAIPPENSYLNGARLSPCISSPDSHLMAFGASEYEQQQLQQHPRVQKQHQQQHHTQSEKQQPRQPASASNGTIAQPPSLHTFSPSQNIMTPASVSSSCNTLYLLTTSSSENDSDSDRTYGDPNDMDDSDLSNVFESPLYLEGNAPEPNATTAPILDSASSAHGAETSSPLSLPIESPAAPSSLSSLLRKRCLPKLLNWHTYIAASTTPPLPDAEFAESKSSSSSRRGSSSFTSLHSQQPSALPATKSPSSPLSASPSFFSELYNSHTGFTSDQQQSYSENTSDNSSDFTRRNNGCVFQESLSQNELLARTPSASTPTFASFQPSSQPPLSYSRSSSNPSSAFLTTSQLSHSSLSGFNHVVISASENSNSSYYGRNNYETPANCNNNEHNNTSKNNETMPLKPTISICTIYSSLSIFCIFTILLFSLSVTSFLFRGVEPRNCRMSYMRPSYIHLEAFDHQNYTRHFSKYSLHLYREKEIDDIHPTPRGIPVLFIPGNSGSYRQVRALAAKSATKYYATLTGESSQSHPQFDFYTADFNEDLTAFHGRSLLDQAEYLNDAIRFILSLYPASSNSTRPVSNDPDERPASANYTSTTPNPKSVILVAHSMGGVVARAMFLLDNYQKDSINTIFTLSAPHTLPPAPFDKDLVAVYDQVNAYWEQSFSQDFIGRNPLASVSLISITGGSLDHMITSESASVASFVPPSNGFTAFTNSIPYVWTSIDHQAIVWCDQFREVFAEALSEISDVRASSKTKQLPARMNVFRKHFLGGFEMGASPEYLHARYHPSLGTKPQYDEPASDENDENIIEKKPGHTSPKLINRASKPRVLVSPQAQQAVLKKHVQPCTSKPTAFTPPAIGDYDTLLWIEDISKFSSPPNKKLVIKNIGARGSQSGGSAYIMPIVSDVVSAATAATTSPKSHLEFTLLSDSKLISYQDYQHQRSSALANRPLPEPSVKMPPSVSVVSRKSRDSSKSKDTANSNSNEMPYNYKSGKAASGLYALVCRYPHAEPKHSGKTLNVIDLTKRAMVKSNSQEPSDYMHFGAEDTDDTRLVGLLCKNIAADASLLPNPNLVPFAHIDKSAHRPPFFDWEDEEEEEEDTSFNKYYSIPRSDMGHLSVIKYDASQLADYDFVAIIDTNAEPVPGFAIAEFAAKSDSRINARSKSLWDLAFNGVSVVLPRSRPFMVDVSFEQMWSSLISYEMKVENLAPQNKRGKAQKPLFPPFIRQYSGESYESKYYLNVNESTPSRETWVPIKMTGVAPFSPFGIRESDSDFEANLFYYGQQSHYYHNLHLQFWTDSSLPKPHSRSFLSSAKENSLLRVTLRIDWYGSMGNLVMHYRIALVAFPVSIIAVVLLIQFRIYNKEGIFISIPQALHIFVQKYLLYFFLGCLVLPYIPSVPLFRDILYFLEPGMDVYSGDGPASIFTNIRRNQFFLGLEPGHLLLLGPVFFSVGIGLTAITFYLLFFITATASLIPLAWDAALGIVCAFISRVSVNNDCKNRQQQRQQSKDVAVSDIHETSKALTPQVSPSMPFSFLHQRAKKRGRDEDYVRSKETKPSSELGTRSNSLRSSSSGSTSTSSSARSIHASLPPGEETWTSTRFKTVRRVVVTTFLFVAVAYTIPCEFAYLVACFAQFATVVKAHYRLRLGHEHVVTPSGRSTSIVSFFNFAMSVMVLMIWIVPITAPILVVWGRKLTAHWNEAFASHHNLLAIGPTLFFVEAVASGKMVPRADSVVKQGITYLTIGYIAFHAIVMGIPRAYMLYHLVNILSGWFLIGCLISTATSGTERRQGQRKRHQQQQELSSSGGSATASAGNGKTGLHSPNHRHAHSHSSSNHHFSDQLAASAPLAPQISILDPAVSSSASTLQLSETLLDAQSPSSPSSFNTMVRQTSSNSTNSSAPVMNPVATEYP